MFERFATLADSDKEFKQVVGIEKKTFHILLKFLEEEHDKGKLINKYKDLISLEKQLLLWFGHIRKNLFSLRLSMEYGIQQRIVPPIINWVENALSVRKELKLPGKESIPEGEELIYIDLDDEKSASKPISQFFNQFKGLSEFKGTDKKFELKFELIGGIYNLEKAEKEKLEKQKNRKEIKKR